MYFAISYKEKVTWGHSGVGGDFMSKYFTFLMTIY